MTRWKPSLKYDLSSVTFYALCFTCLVVFLVWFSNLERASTGPTPPEHTLCVLVPFRNAYEELLEFIPFMNKFLNRQSIRFHFVVVNHVSDNHRFNKGSTFNAGFKIITKDYPDCDYIALHDVDLLPLNNEIPYAYPGDKVYHVAHPDLHPLGMHYDPERYVGGIALISNEQYIRANGFGNNFWGWGGEDRNFFYRMRNNNIARIRPDNLTTDRSNTFKNIHSSSRERDRRCRDQKTRKIIETDFESGLHNMLYELVSVRPITIDEASLSFYNIDIPCDYERTPWCKIVCEDSTIIRKWFTLFKTNSSQT